MQKHASPIFIICGKYSYPLKNIEVVHTNLFDALFKVKEGNNSFKHGLIKLL